MNWLGIITGLFRGGIGRTVEQVAGAVVPNAENQSRRDHDLVAGAQAIAAAANQGSGVLDSLARFLKALPRPMMAFGVIGLFAYAMVDPIEFSARMTALELVPQELWMLLGAIVTFYFGARELGKGRDHRERMTVGQVLAAQEQIRGMRSGSDAPNAPTQPESPVGSSVTGNSSSDDTSPPETESPLTGPPRAESGDSPPVANQSVGGNAAIDEWKNAA